MPTYVLEGGSSARLPGKPLTLRAQSPGGGVQLVALRDGRPDPTAITPMPGMLVLPRIDDAVEVHLVPANGGTFASGSVVSVSAAIELHGDPDPEQAVMTGLDLSGLPRRDLLRVEKQGSDLLVTALGITIDTPLPALAARARDLARAVLGAERVPSDAARSVQVVVDSSASMRRLAADGSVAAAVEVVMGVTRVTSADREVAVCLADTDSEPVRGPGGTPDVAELPRAVHDSLLASTSRTGFDPFSAPALRDDWVRCVVTDQVPGTLHGSDANPPALVVLTPPSAAEVLRARASVPTAWVPTAEGAEQSAYELLMADERALRQVVQALLVGLTGQSDLVATR